MDDSGEADSIIELLLFRGECSLKIASQTKLLMKDKLLLSCNNVTPN